MNADAHSAESFLQFQLVDKPVFAVVAAVRLLVAVAELDVVPPCRGRWARHVTQRAFVVAHCAIKGKEKKINWHHSKRMEGIFLHVIFTLNNRGRTDRGSSCGL